MSNSISVYNLPFTDNSYQNDFNLQYSYDKDPEFEEQYFKITNDGLQINIHKGDNPFLQGSKTDPRSELRGLTSIKDNVNYVLSWEQCLKTYPTNFSFSFFQLFAKDGPNIMLRWKNDKYELLAVQGRNKIVPIKMNITEDIGRFVTWKFEFLLSTIGGYIKVYKNDIYVGEILNANTSGQNDSYLKLGIYSQETQPIDTTSIFIRNLQMTSNT
jgi:hypothetical protein